MNPLANLPPQPVFSPGDSTYATRFNEWVVLANGAMTSYRAEYEAAMADQGIRVQWDTPAAVTGGPFSVPPTYNATLTKDGFSTTTTVSIGRGQSVDPRELAGFDQAFNLKFQAQVQSPQGQLPSSWYMQNPATVNPYFQPPEAGSIVTYYHEPTTTPGPATTTPVGHVTLQPDQAPATPDAGTIVSTPDPVVAVVKYNLWEWNWFYETETGRVGPPPEAVGIADPRALMTRAEWWAKVSGWYANTPPIASGSGSGSGGVDTGFDGTVIIDPPATGTGTGLGSLGKMADLLPLAAGLVAVFFLAKMGK